MRYKLSHLVVMGLIVAMLSSWFTATVMSQSPIEKARNRTVSVHSLFGSCTGVILQTNEVITAAHCIEKEMWVQDRRATVYKIDKDADLALLIVQTIVIDRIRVADVSVGDEVFTWGYPFSSPNLVYGKGYVAVIQFNTCFSTNPANPGQSGSGIFDKDGNLVGILGGIMTATGYSVNRLPETIRKFWEVP